MFLLKNRPKTMKNRPKSRPTMFLLDLLYKTVLWCCLFDFMLISNGTGLGLKFRTNHWAIFSRKKLPKAIKNRPNGKISPNLVTLVRYNPRKVLWDWSQFESKKKKKKMSCLFFHRQSLSNES